MQRLKCIGGPLYGQEYSHPYNEFTFLDQHTGKKFVYSKHTLDFKPPQYFFVVESISQSFAYQLALQVLHSIPN